MTQSKQEHGTLYFNPIAIGKLLLENPLVVAFQENKEPFQKEDQLLKTFGSKIKAVWVPNQEGKSWIHAAVQNYPHQFSERVSGTRKHYFLGFLGQHFYAHQLESSFWDLQTRGSEHTKERVAIARAIELAQGDYAHKQEMKIYDAEDKQQPKQ